MKYQQTFGEQCNYTAALSILNLHVPEGLFVLQGPDRSTGCTSY